MNRLFGGGKSKALSATNLQAQKSKQIESLRKVGAFEIIRDVEYRVLLPGSTNLTILINLPAQFPSEKPVLTVVPAVRHPWVDPQMKVIGCPNINNFSVHSDLGQCIQAVLDEFKKTPPEILPQHYILGLNNPTIGSGIGPTSPPSGPPPSYPGSQFSIPSYTPPSAVMSAEVPPPLPPRRTHGGGGEMSTDQSALPGFPSPNILASFPALKDMKLFELQELIDNESDILDMVQKMPELVSFVQQRENLASSCVQIAQSNLAKKPEIEVLKEAIIAKNAEYDQLKAEFESKCKRHMTLSDQLHPSHIQTNLKVAVMEADEESENMAEKFLNKEIDADSFVKKFMEKRTLCHMRRAKEEKLSSIILSQGFQF